MTTLALWQSALLTLQSTGTAHFRSGMIKPSWLLENWGRQVCVSAHVCVAQAVGNRGSFKKLELQLISMDITMVISHFHRKNVLNSYHWGLYHSEM